jgi:hypothetical protein
VSGWPKPNAPSAAEPAGRTRETAGDPDRRRETAGDPGRPRETAGGRPDADGRPDAGVTARVETFAELAGRIERLPPSGGLRTRLVAVDGRGAAGKTTFAARLAVALGGAPIVHTDDVVAEVGHPWWPALEQRVLAPLDTGGPAVLIVEGVSSSRRAIAGRLAYGIWLHVPTAPRLARAIERDGPATAADWAGYEAEENAFFAADPAPDRADLVVDGAPTLPHHPTTEYVRLR